MADVVVVGTGGVGMATALGMSQMGYSVALVGPRYRYHGRTEWDERIYAISPGSQKLLEQIKVWNAMDAARLQPVRDMRVFASPESTAGELHFAAFEAGANELAWIIENRNLMTTLDSACGFAARLERCEAQATDVATSADGVRVTLADGRVVEGRLLVGADGAQSPVRARLGMLIEQRSYDQHGVVANFVCERPHGDIARQWFREDGILAFLPLPQAPDGRDRMSMVWSTSPSLAEELLALPAEALAARVAEAGVGSLGALENITPAHAFPLRLMKAVSPIGLRTVLLGDAAHVVHPLAGQGLNLGLQDVRDFLAVMSAREPVRDVGDALLLRRYERARALDVFLMRATTDGLHRLFSTSNPALAQLRSVGMDMLNRLVPLKRRLISQAMR